MQTVVFNVVSGSRGMI